MVVLILLGVLKRPAWQASLAGLIVAFFIAIFGWQFPVNLALSSTVNGMTFALWPVMWIVFNALLLYNVAVASGRFDAFRDWIFQNLPNDRRVVLIVIGYCFGALLEGIAGFGTPIAICSSLLILVGWPALEALTFMLILARRRLHSARLACRLLFSQQLRTFPTPRSAPWSDDNCRSSR